MHKIHVITPPSVWLPDPPCHRVLVLGGDTVRQRMDMCEQIHDLGAPHSWALYHVETPDVTQIELTDWILTQSVHVHAVWCHVDSHHVVTWAALFAPDVKIIHAQPPWHKLLYWNNMRTEDLSEVIKNQAQRCTS